MVTLFCCVVSSLPCSVPDSCLVSSDVLLSWPKLKMALTERDGARVGVDEAARRLRARPASCGR